MPDLYIITGSNGAGKSTIGATFLPGNISGYYPVFDGDKLFMQKQRELWLSGIKAHKEARKIAYEHVTNTFDLLVEKALNNKDHFVYEGHFTNESTWEIPKLFKQAGYAIHLIFLGLSSTNLSELRVIDRTKLGGHYVDTKTIADNYFGNLEKLDIHYPMFDTLQIVDTSETEHILVTVFSNGQPIFSLPSHQIPAWFITYLPNLYSRISQQLL